MKIPRRRLTPTQIVERSPTNSEMAWYKKPRMPPEIGTYNDKPGKQGKVWFREPTKKEKTDIHTHNHLPNERLFVLPGSADIKGMISYPKNTSIMAIRKGREVAGYTFAQVKNPKKLKKIKKFVKHKPKAFRQYRAQPETPFRNAKDQKKFAKQIRKSAEKMQRAGLKLRFVANRKRGFAFDKQRMQFVRRE